MFHTSRVLLEARSTTGKSHFRFRESHRQKRAKRATLIAGLIVIVFLAACTSMAAGQECVSPKVLVAGSGSQETENASAQKMALMVDAGTPLQIALEEEVHIKKAGQPIRGRTVQPIYAFDHEVVPAGTEVTGRIASIDGLSGKKRIMGALNADFTPARKVAVEFDELVLSQGKRITLHAEVMPWSGQVMRLASAKEDKKSVAAGKIDQAKQEARTRWQQAKAQIKQPGKIHRLTRYAVGQLPVRPQYLEQGAVYVAELREPLDFGFEQVAPQQLASIGTALPDQALIHALLVTPLNSANSKKGEPVEAVLSQPLFDGGHLILPAGSRIKGSVLEVQPARRLHHNGQLRIGFREIVPPDGVEQKIVASLESVQAGKNDHVKLDSEGGAEASTPKTRYLSTGLSLVLATAAFHQHTDADDAGQSQNGVAGGAGGFKLVGIVLGIAIKSQTFGMAMGAYGASRSVYSHFLSRGQEVIFPRNTNMEIGIGKRGKTVLPSEAESRPQ